MFLIPSRTSRPNDDPIFALNGEARARAAKGESIVNATVGALLDDDGKLAVIPSVAEAIREVPSDVEAGYAPISGPPDFLRAVIRDLFGARAAADQAVAVATPGGTGALRHAIANFLEPGQRALTTSFYWGPYKTLCDEGDKVLATFRMFDAKGRLDAADLEQKLGALLDSQRRALVLLNSPCHNPTGYSFDPSEWRDIVDVVKRAANSAPDGTRLPVTVALDVAYARYGAGDLGESIDRALEMAGDALLLFAWTASKAFTQYGARVGALVAVHPDAAERSRVQNALSYSCRGTWSNCNAGGMAAITRALVEPELAARVEKERAALKSTLDRRVARWNELAGAAKLRYPRYDGGFFVTVFTDDAFEVAKRMKDDGLFVVPQAGALRVALCSVAERDVGRLVDGIAKHAR